MEIDNILLEDVFIIDQSAVKTRASEYLLIHNKENDCHILAEAEIGNAEILLTYDQKMLKRLRDKTKTIKMLSPTEYWTQLHIPLGARPVTSPSERNPLSKKSWWMWR